VKALRQLGQPEEAGRHLEVASVGLQQAIASSEHHYEPQRYLHLLEGLRHLYFEQGRYLEAFQVNKNNGRLSSCTALEPLLVRLVSTPQNL
jgi:hypothetical protein